MVEWIKKEKLIEYLLSDSSHGELIKRASQILKFMGEQNALDDEILNLLWKCQEGKHEETVRIVFESIINLG